MVLVDYLYEKSEFLINPFLHLLATPTGMGEVDVIFIGLHGESRLSLNLNMITRP